VVVMEVATMTEAEEEMGMVTAIVVVTMIVAVVVVVGK
jgi:hypothetical protein